MDFELTGVQAAWREKGAALGREVAADPAAATVVQGAARSGLLDPAADLVALVVAIEALARESPAAGVALALHAGTLPELQRFALLVRGEAAAAVGLSSDAIPQLDAGRLSGRAPWVAPLTNRGIVVVSPKGDADRTAYAVAIDTPGVAVERVATAALAGLVCGHVTFTAVDAEPVGAAVPIMTRIRILMAAAGLGMGTRALGEALAAAKASRTAAAGEQTVQGLLADAATDLDAAMLMTWKAAAGAPPSLAGASLAKLMATAAAQRAVERATQVVGADSFQQGHIIERLAQDVRALELFAGRTESLRAAAAEELF